MFIILFWDIYTIFTDLISKKSLEQIVVIVYDGTDHLPKERWALRFDDRDENPSDIELSVEDIKKRFSDILKQIKASSNMLPLLNGKCKFSLMFFLPFFSLFLSE